MIYLRKSLLKAYLARIEDGGASKRALAKVHQLLKNHRKPKLCRPNPSNHFTLRKVTKSAIKRSFAKNHFLVWKWCGSDPSLPIKSDYTIDLYDFYDLYDLLIHPSGPILSKLERNDQGRRNELFSGEAQKISRFICPRC